MSRYSIIPTLAIQDRRLSTRDLTVFLALGSFTDKSGYAFPAHKTLAAMLGVSRQIVIRSLNNLEKCGYLRVRARNRASDGGQTSNAYFVSMDYTPPAKHMRGTAENDDGISATPPIENLTPPVTPDVTPPVTPDVTPPVTPDVTPPVTPDVTPLTSQTNNPINVPHFFDAPEKSDAPKTKARGSRLPDDWMPKPLPENIFKRIERMPPSWLQEKADEFVDHWTAESGSKAVKRDWQAAWRTWIRNAIKFERIDGGKNVITNRKNGYSSTQRAPERDTRDGITRAVDDYIYAEYGGSLD